MTKFLFVILFFSLISNVFGQDSHPTKSELNKAFKKSIEQDLKNRIITHSNPWIIINDDSLYFKSDLIKLYQYQTSNKLSKVCKTLNWSFYKKNKFVLTKAEKCKEPPTIEGNLKENWFETKIEKNDLGLILEIYNKNKLADRFRVIEINNDKTLITLKRLTK
jgi:hypothetical protein